MSENFKVIVHEDEGSLHLRLMGVLKLALKYKAFCDHKVSVKYFCYCSMMGMNFSP
jgi:hypothetical protein